MQQVAAGHRGLLQDRQAARSTISAEVPQMLSPHSGTRKSRASAKLFQRLLRRPRKKILTLMVSILVGGAAAQPAAAVLITDPPLPVTHRVDVRLIQTAEDDGSPVATALGNSSQRADIEAGIDQIWAQAGIDIRFEADLVRFNNTFALRGDGGTRPQGDLGAIRSLAGSAGVLSDDANTLNLFLVDITPGFGVRPENTANGLAYIGSNGIASFVGESLLGNGNNRDLIARVLAHEIGHNLGLRHVAERTPNLMSPRGTSQQLSTAQIGSVLASRFSRLLPNLPGDFNGDGAVNAADYSVWRDGLGTQYNQSDYALWRGNYGSDYGSGSNFNSSGADSAVDQIPEPPAVLFACLMIGVWCYPPTRVAIR